MSEPRIYYEDDSVQLWCGDCRDVLPKLGSVDHVITDPPYSEHVHSKSRAGDGGPKRNGRGEKNDCSFSRQKDLGFAALTTELRHAVADLVAPLLRRWALVFSDVESSDLWRGALVYTGLEYVRTGAWIKVGATPQFTGDRPAVGFEAITIAHPAGKKRWNGGGKHAVWSHAIALDRGGSTPRFHPTEKPLSLMTELASLFTDEGETVLDPFAGSGTTLVAAKQLGRKAIGVELEEKWCEAAVKRLSQEVLPLRPREKPEQPPLFGAVELVKAEDDQEPAEMLPAKEAVIPVPIRKL